MKVAIIPARGGSKRIPQKNIKEFCGKPMIAHAIQAAKDSALFEHIFVSTDDHEVGRVAREHGAEVPFMRPINLADDFTPTVPVIRHAIKECEKIGWEVEVACCIYPSVPLIDINDLHKALDLLIKEKADYSFPIAEFTSSIQRALRKKPNGKMEPFYPQYEKTRTQDLEVAYHDAGQFYWGSRNAWLSKDNIHSIGTGLIIPNWRVVDIDTVSDWKRAEILYKNISKQ